jgi:hypothetical protein
MLAVAGCVDATAPIDEELLGTYQLQTINQVDLPFRLDAGEGEWVEVMNGSITLNRDQTFHDELRWQVISRDGETTSGEGVIDGYFAPGAGVLTFFPAAGGAYQATLGADGGLETSFGDLRLAYHR